MTLSMLIVHGKFNTYVVYTYIVQFIKLCMDLNCIKAHGSE